MARQLALVRKRARERTTVGCRHKNIKQPKVKGSTKWACPVKEGAELSENEKHRHLPASPQYTIMALTGELKVE